MTARERRAWYEAAGRYIEWQRKHSRSSEAWLRNQWLALMAWPKLWVRCGIEPPRSPRDVKAVHLRRYFERRPVADTTGATYLVVLRCFLRWAHSPLALEKIEWQHAKAKPRRRRWLETSELAALYRASRGRERVLVALEGFNGLRRVEVLRLKVGDLTLSGSKPEMTVLGKGPFGGKPRTIPMSPTVYAVLAEWVAGKPTTAMVFPHHPKTADRDLMAASRRAGLTQRVSNHDLRRSFGRISYHAGVPLIDLKNLYGHESLDMTVWYIGIEDDQMRSGLATFEQAIANVPTL
jgi:integrase